MAEAVILCNAPQNVANVYGAGRRERLAGLVDLLPDIIGSDQIEARADELRSIRHIFSTWGMPELGEAQIDRFFPRLENLFYAAGSVKGFAAPFLDRGVTVVSAWAANAVPVAEFTVAQVLLANKGYFANTRASGRVATRGRAFRGPGNFGETVALLGAGMIGRTVISLLKPFELNVIVWDPFLSDDGAAALGVERVATLEDAFARGFVVSNHLANVPATRGLLQRHHFEGMRPHATFINTGRGATVVEEDLTAVLQARPDLQALLDVTDPEPPALTSPFYTLDNVALTAHIAGSMNNEVVRMADFMLEEFAALVAGRPLRFAISRDMLERLA